MSRWPGRLITKTPVVPSGPVASVAVPGIWTIPEVAYWVKQGLWPDPAIVPDPYWSYVSFLLGTTSTNAQQNNTFLDGSTNNFTITRFGNTTQGSFAPYGPDWSNYFDGSGDYLTAPASSSWIFSGDYTLEAWVYPTASGADMQISGTGGSGSNDQFGITSGVGTGRIYWAYTAVGNYLTTTANIPAFAWTHIAVTRSSNTLRAFVNGVQVFSGTMSTTVGQNAINYIGRRSDGFNSFTGYMSNLRLVNGTAVYTAAFTPPTAPLTAISGTSLLTCQSNRFRDASTNNFTITKFGETSVTAFSPFNLPPPGYTGAAYGGSGYFDGTGDGLTAPNNAAFNLSNGNFTLECWVYNTEVTNSIGYAGIWGGGYILYREGTTYRFYYGGPGGSPLTPSIAAVTNAWTHLAVVRNGTTLTFYVNGVSGGSTNVSTTAINFSGQPFGIGANFETGSPGFPFTGYMAGLRLVKGTAIYTAAFTPPTTPPTAVSGTSILCNFTNAGIFDASMNNDMETVGSAQVSSAQAKFGTTSLYSPNSTSYLNSRFNQSMAFGTGDFTIEAWVYSVATSAAYTCIVSSRDGIVSNANAVFFGFKPTTNQLTFFTSSEIIGTTTAVSTGTWTHVALVRNAGATAIYINGVSSGTATFTTTLTGTGLSVGNEYNGTSGSGGLYIDDLRITKGFARYTANFTPPDKAMSGY